VGGDVGGDGEDEVFVYARVGTVATLGEDLVAFGVFHWFIAVALVEFVGGVVGISGVLVEKGMEEGRLTHLCGAVVLIV
jgi:hypothetical protein